MAAWIVETSRWCHCWPTLTLMNRSYCILMLTILPVVMDALFVPTAGWKRGGETASILYTKLPLLKLFSNCCLLCFLLLSQLVVNEISVYRVKGEWFSSTFVFVSILLCHRQGLEGCSIKISLNISACSLHYWCQFQYNLLFHMHICVSYIEFVNLGVGYSLRLIKSFIPN